VPSLHLRVAPLSSRSSSMARSRSERELLVFEQDVPHEAPHPLPLLVLRAREAGARVASSAVRIVLRAAVVEVELAPLALPRRALASPQDAAGPPLRRATLCSNGRARLRGCRLPGPVLPEAGVRPQAMRGKSRRSLGPGETGCGPSRFSREDVVPAVAAHPHEHTNAGDSIRTRERATMVNPRISAPRNLRRLRRTIACEPRQAVEAWCRVRKVASEKMASSSSKSYRSDDF
jgi:hypothetical protein